MEKTGNEFKELIEKVEFLDKQLQKDHFSNPIRQALIGIRSSLIDVAEEFEKKFEELDVVLNQANPDEILKNQAISPQQTEAQPNVDSKELEKRNYQILHLCKSFNKHETESKSEIAQLKQQAAKDEYRINFLLKTIESLEEELKRKN